MAGTSSSIFRPDALQRYAQSPSSPLPPRFTSSRGSLLIWLLLGLLVAAGVGSWLIEAPLDVSGPATLTTGSDFEPSFGHELVAVATLPPESAPRLRAGQGLILSSSDGRLRLRGRLVSVEPGQSREDAVRATARLEVDPSALVDAADVRRVYKASVDTGTRRLFSLLPSPGRLFAGAAP